MFDLPPMVSKRTSVNLQPHRNIVKELLDAAMKYQPRLRRGTYYSLPEWFHPDYAKYGFGDWPGGQAKDPFTNQTVPYTGYVSINDYLENLILPSMKTLAAMGTDIMWCDIGGPNLTLQFASEWFNSAATSGRQVTLNNRCGVPGDFDTPEYPRSSPPVVRPRKWESNLGMDPYSYGYNAATPDEAYMDARTIVKTLVDTVSKGGNFLLDIGPKEDGSIAEVVSKTLKEAGNWIREHEESIFGTKTWFVTPQEGENIRFALSEDAFYISFLEKPKGIVFIQSPVPWTEGDNVTVIGGKLAGGVVKSWKNSTGRLSLEFEREVLDADRWVWVLKINY
jgi:alpha-L-fucosidase